jgi:hypothetical protein
MTGNAYNLAATFPGRRRAQQAADLLSKDLSRSKIEIKSKGDDAGVQYAEMRDELEGVVASPALGSALTKSQAEGAGGGAVLLGGVGLVLGALIGFFINGAPGSEISVVRWLMTWALVPAVAGGTLGVLAGGLLKQRYAPAPHDSAPPREAAPDAGIEPAGETVVEISTDDESEFAKALDILEPLHPQRLDKFNSEGEVISTADLGDGADN